MRTRPVATRQYPTEPLVYAFWSFWPTQCNYVQEEEEKATTSIEDALLHLYTKDKI